MYSQSLLLKVSKLNCIVHEHNVAIVDQEKYSQQTIFPFPFCSDLGTPIRNLAITPTENALNVQWDHDYYLCHNFTVYLNDTAVPECTNITVLNCAIKNLDTAVGSEVTVVATESNTEPVNASLTVTALDITGIGSSM